MNNKVHIVILNITQWKSDHTYPRCYYGKLILCTNPDVTFHNIRQFDVNKLGERIEVTRQLTREEAVKLDKRYHNANYTQCWDEGDMTTNRFDDYIQATEAGMEMFRELKMDVPFISLLEGKKFYRTRTFNEDEVNYLVRYKLSARDWVMYFFSDQADEQDREIGENMIKQHGSLENLLNSDWVKKMQDQYDRMDLFETDD